MRDALRCSRRKIPPLSLRRSGEFPWSDRTATREQCLPYLDRDACGDLVKKARARAVQLPAWNEALGLPRPWDQQWSMRMQQIMAFETDLLEFDDLFDGNPAVDRKVEELKEGARAELANLDAMGGAIEAIDYMKSALVQSNADQAKLLIRELLEFQLSLLISKYFLEKTTFISLKSILILIRNRTFYKILFQS